MYDYFFEFFKIFGISVNENSHPVVLVLLVVFFMSFIALLSVINISIPSGCIYFLFIF